MTGPTRLDQGLARHQRLRQSRLFDETYAQGNKRVGRFMVLWLRAGEGAALRLGVVAGRKVGDAVARARARRRLREVYRRNRSQLAGEFDVILIARAPVTRAPWDEIVGEFLGLARRAGIVKNDTRS
ncbi:MAG TPA: ribonuclease P protein component [Kiritimatiellia bacterium]|jgi:ribonuclease P protein component